MLHAVLSCPEVSCTAQLLCGSGALTNWCFGCAKVGSRSSLRERPMRRVAHTRLRRVQRNGRRVLVAASAARRKCGAAAAKSARRGACAAPQGRANLVRRRPPRRRRLSGERHDPQTSGLVCDGEGAQRADEGLQPSTRPPACDVMAPFPPTTSHTAGNLSAPLLASPLRSSLGVASSLAFTPSVPSSAPSIAVLSTALPSRELQDPPHISAMRSLRFLLQSTCLSAPSLTGACLPSNSCE